MAYFINLMAYLTASNSGEFSSMASIALPYCSSPLTTSWTPPTAGMQHIPMYDSLSRTQKYFVTLTFFVQGEGRRGLCDIQLHSADLSVFQF